MNIKIFTPNGIEYEKKDVIYVALFDKEGASFGMLNNHLPVISTISIGHLEVKLNEKETDYIALSGGILKNRNDEISVTCESIAFGESKDEAMTAFYHLLEIRRNQNRERNIELALAENELKKEIKKSGAGHI